MKGICQAGYTGITCNQQIFVTSAPTAAPPNNPCNSNPCLYGGSCYPNSGTYTSYVCACIVGYTGQRCEQLSTTTVATTITPFNPCSRNPCLNSGYCVANQNTNSYYCICTASYFGVNCEQFVTTTQAPTTQAPNPCNSNPCLYGGTCYPGNNGYFSYTCSCPFGYTGTNCNQVVVTTTVAPITNICSINPCRNGGNLLDKLY